LAITLGAITALSTAARNALADAFDTLANTGATAPHLIVQTSGGGSTLIDFTLDGTAAFGVSSTGVITLDVSPAVQNTAANSGAPGQYIITDSDGTTILTGTASGDSVVASNTYQISSFTLTMPAS
jgi:streptogramin lyase